MLKGIFIDGADLLARFFKVISRRSLACSVWFADAAEALDAGSTITDIRKQREEEGE